MAKKPKKPNGRAKAARPPRNRSAHIDVTPQIRSVLQPAISALRRIAQYELEPAIDQRMRELGERKEFLKKREHDELLGLVEFWERRTIERLEAQIALKRLGEVVPELVAGK